MTSCPHHIAASWASSGLTDRHGASLSFIPPHSLSCICHFTPAILSWPLLPPSLLHSLPAYATAPQPFCQGRTDERATHTTAQCTLISLPPSKYHRRSGAITAVARRQAFPANALAAAPSETARRTDERAAIKLSSQSLFFVHLLPPPPPVLRPPPPPRDLSPINAGGQFCFSGQRRRRTDGRARDRVRETDGHGTRCARSLQEQVLLCTKAEENLNLNNEDINKALKNSLSSIQNSTINL